ncbi:F-actin-monooxygenase MICAL2 isoform X10 [Colossoma macropomum]|uniref:F-actin-monooxygenase MICAL2 isoform X10 n=1 Tax=Colossoma macropomum TaxID=42526 RepID=UPI001863EBD3|nr:F-actin-monooxygenase MICAL2 isoform X10 [Colossoma macropomum]
MGETEDEKSQASKLFENFVQAPTCKSTLQAFNILCSYLELDPLEHSSFYSSLKSKLTCWKAKALWSKLDKRASHKEYKKGKACTGTKCLIIGGGPCGLRTAIELAFLGAKAVVIEKRDTFSRNNVLHLWPFTIHDLRNLGAKKFYGKFCAGAIDHISIRQLQLMLLKIALLVGVEFHINVEFVKLLEPPEDQENEGPGWRAEIRPADHPVADFDFDVVIGADGRRNTLEGFRRKEFRGKLAIAITANFINRNTTAEAKVDEISGVAFIFNQKFFQDLKQETGIDLENIVYYKDNTHYFVMTAKKQSLLDKGVIIYDYIDTDALLSSENVNQEALLSYAREAADYATHYQLPTLDYAMNHLDQPDVAMFDFTCMYASENAALIRERFGHQLLVALVGDSLLEPFWPMGTGCARGFLAAFDTVWMIRSWSQGRNPLEVLAERESLYRLLPQTTPENIAKNFDQYTIDPGTRYPNLNSNCVRPHQVRNYYICGELKSCSLERAATIRRPVNLARRESEIRPSRLLTWCQKQTEGYKGVSVTDLSSSWRSGLAFCALIHRFRAHLIDYDSLNEEDAAQNAQLAFDVAEKEFGIKPFTTGKEMASEQEQDKNSMVTYLSKFYELFRGTPLPPSDSRRETHENNDECSSRPSRPVYRSLSLTQPRKRIPKDDKKVDDNDSFYKRRRKVCSYLEEVTNISSRSSSLASEGQELKENKVKFMASQLLAKFEESTPSCTLRRQRKTQTQNTREFHKKSIKEKAVHLSSLFSGDSTSLPQTSSSSHSTSTLSSPQSTVTSSASPPLSSSPSLLLHQRPKCEAQQLDMQLCEMELQSVYKPHTTDPSAPNFTLHSNSKLTSPHPLPPCTSSTFPSSHRSSSSSLLVQQNGRDIGHCFSLQKESKMPKGYKIMTFPNKLFRKTRTSQQPEVQLCENEMQKDSVNGSNVLSSSSSTSIFNHQRDMELPQSGGDRNIKTSKKTYPTAANPSHSSSALPLPYPPPECIAAYTSSFPSSCVSSKPQHLGTRLSKTETQGETQNNSHHSSSSTTYFSLRKQTEVSPSKEDSHSSKQRTVGKVSLVVGARAETLLTLYENDHRPKSACSGSPASLRRDFPQSLGDVCHACKKRVYMAERLRAEGLFFHSECFRCDTCSAPLSQGGHAFDSEQGKLYCKLHFSQRKFVKCGGIFDTHMPPKGAVHPSTRPSPAGVETSLRQSPGTLTSVLKRSLHWSLHVSRTVCAMPRRVANWLGGKVRDGGRHLRDNAEDYAFLYELLSVGLPLLVAMHELLLQLQAEATL